MAAVIKFAIHGNSLNAFLNSGAGKVPQIFNPDTGVDPAVVTDAGAIGGQAINFDNTNISALFYPGFNNSQTTGKISILTRIAPTYTGAPGANSDILCVMGPKILNGNQNQQIQLDHFTDGNLYLSVSDTSGGGIVFQNIGAWSPVAGTYYDIVVTWDGTAGANAFHTYINAVLFASTTIGRLWTAGASAQTAIQIAVGADQILVGLYKLNEYVLWDDVISPSGLGLTGSTRTTFVSTAGYVLDPTANIDPGITRVLTGTAYEIAGVPLVGTLVQITNIYSQASLIGQAPPGTAAIPLVFTQGDTPLLNLRAVNGPNGTPFNLTGAVFTSKIKDTDGSIAIIPNGQHTANPDQAANPGVFTLQLLSTDSLASKLGAGKELITEVVQGGSIVYFHGVKLITVLRNVPAV